MNAIFRIGLIVGGALLTSIAGHAQQSQSQSFGDYTIHYSALPTDVLQPQTAQTYGIERSTRRGLVNIAVYKKTTGADEQAVEIALSGKASNLAGHDIPITFRQLHDGGNVYYIGEFPLHGADTYQFRIEVTPQGATQPYRLKFSQDFVAGD